MKKVYIIFSLLLIVAGLSNVNAQTRVNISINSYPGNYPPRPVRYCAPAPPPPPVVVYHEPVYHHGHAPQHFHNNRRHEHYCYNDNRNRNYQHPAYCR